MKLYHNGQVEGWQIPGQQDKKATRVDVPSSPADLAAWLNFRRVGPTGTTAEHELEREPLSEGEEPWILGKPTREPAHYAPQFHGDYGTAEFVPIAKTAAIAAAFDACPQCQRTWTAQVLAGIAGASPESLQLIAQAIEQRTNQEND